MSGQPSIVVLFPQKCKDDKEWLCGEYMVINQYPISGIGGSPQTLWIEGETKQNYIFGGVDYQEIMILPDGPGRTACTTQQIKVMLQVLSLQNVQHLRSLCFSPIHKHVSA